MHKSKNNLRIFVLIIIATILFVPTIDMASFAEEKKKTNSVNDIAITVVFHFREKQETVKTFEVFTQNSGYSRATETPTFSLQGVVGGDKVMLYQAADMTYLHGGNLNHDYSEFDVDVTLHNEKKSYRQFTYSDCYVKDYAVSTDFDDEEAWDGEKKFALIDEFEFECRGYMPYNLMYKQMLHDEEMRDLGPSTN